MNQTVKQSEDTGATLLLDMGYPLYPYTLLTRLLCLNLPSTYILTLLLLVPCCNSTFFPVSRSYKNGLPNCFLPKRFGKS